MAGMIQQLLDEIRSSPRGKLLLDVGKVVLVLALLLVGLMIMSTLDTNGM